MITGFDIPSIRQLIKNISDDLNSRLNGEDSKIIGSVLYALARVIAGAVYIDLQLSRYLSKQIFVSSADNSYLDRIGDIWGVVRNPATKSSGDAAWDSSLTSLITIPAGTTAVDAAGELYETTVDVDTSAGGGIAGGSVWGATVNVEALTLGAAGNLANGAILTLQSSIAGIITEGQVKATDGLTGGVDLELDDDYRQRILDRVRNPPQGGAAKDYILWIRDTDGVDIEHAWILAPYPTPGQVRGFFTEKTPARTPVAGSITAVQSHVDPLRPVTATYDTLTPAKEQCTINAQFAIQTDSGLTEAQVIANIQNELTSMFLRKLIAEGDKREGDGTINNSDFSGAIARAPGVDFFTLTDVNGGGATANFVYSQTEFPDFNASGSIIVEYP